MVNKGCSVRFIMLNLELSPLIRVIKSLPFLVWERETSLQMEVSYTNVNFFYKRKTCAIFRAFPTSGGSQRPLPQNNPCAKKVYFVATSSGTLHSESQRSYFNVLAPFGHLH